MDDSIGSSLHIINMNIAEIVPFSEYGSLATLLAIPVCSFPIIIAYPAEFQDFQHSTPASW